MTGAEQENGGRTAEEASLLLLRPLAAGMLALVVAMGVGRFAYTPILPGMQEALDLGDRQTGALASSNYLGYLVGAVLTAVFPLGSWRDAALRACLAAVVATTGLMALTTGFAAWAALRFLAGVASAGVFVLASGVVLGVLRERGRSDLSGWLYSGVGIGIAAAGLTVLALHGLLPEGAPAGWRADWIGSAAVAAALAVPCWVWLPKEGAAAQAVGPVRAAGDGARLAIALLFVAYFLEGLGYIVTGTFLVKIVEGMPGLGGFGVGAWILAGLAAVPSTVLWARAAARVGYVAALVAAYAAQAVGVVLPVLSNGAWAAAASAVLFGGTFMGIAALTMTFAGRQRPHQAARVIGALTAAYGLGQVAGPLLAASLAGGPEGFGPSLTAASAAVLLGGLSVLAIAPIAAREAKRREREGLLQATD